MNVNNFTIELSSISFHNKSAEFDILDCVIKNVALIERSCDSNIKQNECKKNYYRESRKVHISLEGSQTGENYVIESVKALYFLISV